MGATHEIGADGRKNHWRNGAAEKFGETCFAKLKTTPTLTRMILFRDIERPSPKPVLRWINRTFARGMIRAAATKYIARAHAGAPNRIFPYAYGRRTLDLRIEQRNRVNYHLLK